MSEEPTDESSEEHSDSGKAPAPEMSIDLTESQLARVRRVGALGPEASEAKDMIYRLAAVFAEAGVEAESVSAVSLGERTIIMVEIGEGDVREVVKFLGGILAHELSGTVVGLIGNHAFTHRLNVALDAAGHGTDLLLPDEIIWVVPKALEATFRELDENFPPSAQSDDEERPGQDSEQSA